VTRIDPVAAPADGELHVWRFSLDDPPVGEAPLTADERARAARFRFPLDARRFVAGRAAMRAVLARYCDLAAHDVELVTGEQGKPALADASARRMWFNLAHSGPYALLVVAAHELVGADIEELRPGFADDEIAERFFAPAEVARLRGLPVPEQEDAFFRCWTRKEAYIKARGGGLHIPLDSFTVAFGAAEVPALTWVDGAAAEPACWTMFDVSAATPACIAAVAVRERSQRVELPVLIDLHG
jgi:4'-phosphopantetheinyl transferase